MDVVFTVTGLLSTRTRRRFARSEPVAAVHLVHDLGPRLLVLGRVLELDLVAELARVGAVLRVPALHVLLEMYHCKFILFEIHCTQLTTLVPVFSFYLIKKFISNKYRTLAMKLLIYLKMSILQTPVHQLINLDQ